MKLPAAPRKRRQKSLEWATKQLEKMARAERDPALKVLWLRSAARGYEELSELRSRPFIPASRGRLE